MNTVHILIYYTSTIYSVLVFRVLNIISKKKEEVSAIYRGRKVEYLTLI